MKRILLRLRKVNSIYNITLDNNFGEIEMCLNEKLEYDVKIKSRSCELFVLKKNDFLRLSVNFKEFIENFLYKSLMKFLKFSDMRKKMINELEKFSKLEKNKNFRDEENSILKQVNQEEDDHSSMLQSEEISEENSEKEMTDSIVKHEQQSAKSSRNSTLNKKIRDEKFARMEISDKEDRSKLRANLSESNEDKKNSSVLNKSRENIAYSDDSVDKYKNDIYKKFIKKIDKILEHIEDNSVEFGDDENNPKILLKKLKLESNIIEKNILMDKLESFLNNFYNN